MPRRARVVFPGVPHHVIQRGTRKQDVYFCEEDRYKYLEWLRHFSLRYEVSILSYCLMSNHVHLIVVPDTESSLSFLFKSLHSKYARYINKQKDWVGHLWQARFFSSPLDESYLYHAVRYVEMNPVRAGLVARAEDYPWSSANSRVLKKENLILDFTSEWNRCLPQAEMWSAYLNKKEEEHEITLRNHVNQNLPCGHESFIEKLEQKSGSLLRYRKQGRPRKR